MDIPRFESQMTRIIPSFAGFTAFTPTVPKLYWDVKSQEQRILGICKMLCKVIAYADMLGENVDEIKKTLDDIIDGKLDEIIEQAILAWFEENEPQIMADLEYLKDHNEYHERALLGLFNFENARAYVRDEYDINGVRYGAQGFCAFEHEGHTISIVYLMHDENEEGYVRTYVDDTFADEEFWNLGHGACLEYYNGYVYVPVKIGLGTTTLYKFHVNEYGDIGELTLVCQISDGAIGIDQKTGTAYLIGSSYIDEVDLNGGSQSRYIDNPSWNTPGNVAGQTYFTFRYMDELYFAEVCSFPNSINIIDHAGNFVCTKKIPTIINYISVGEMEAMHIFPDGTYYFNGAGDAAPTATPPAKITKTWIGFTGNIFDLNRTTYPNTTGMAYAAIHFWGNSPQYKFPSKQGRGYVSGSNPINVYYGQDVQAIVDSGEFKQFAITIEEDSDDNAYNGIYLNDFVGIISFKNHKIAKLNMDGSVVTINGVENMLESGARAVEARLGTIVSVLNIFAGDGLTGSDAGLRLNQSTAIVKNGQNLSYIYMEGGAGTSTILKADLT